MGRQGSCKAGVITGAFAVPTHETMRVAILDGPQGHQRARPSATASKPRMISARSAPQPVPTSPATPRTVCAIIVNIGDAGAAAAALTDEQAKKVYLLSADFTLGGVEQLKQGQAGSAARPGSVRRSL